MKTAFCLTFIALLLAVSSLSAATHYVSRESTNAMPPYTNWATAASDIQQAVDVAAARDVVVVSNGVYYGSLAVTNQVALVSVNGPEATIIDGRLPPWNPYNYCVGLLTDGASLSGFTLTHGVGNGFSGGLWTRQTKNAVTNCLIVDNQSLKSVSGGASGCILYNCTLSGNSSCGAWDCTLYNCTLSGNSYSGAYGCTLYNCTLTGNSASPGAQGGGAHGSTLYNCVLSGNSATTGGGGGVLDCTLYNCTLSGNSAWVGGGANGCTLYNCTLTGNSAPGGGGGALDCTLYNCIVYFNSSSGGDNYDALSTLNYCCTTPDPGGVGNITNAPLFVDYANGNLRPQSNSPCINAGNNAYATNATDLDGNPRIVSGTVDIGAYEHQGTGSLIFNVWLQQYGLPTDGSADYVDPDHDGMNNWQEWVCSTDPTNALSALRLLSPSVTGTNATVTWRSVAGVNYFLERSVDLRSPFTLVATNIFGQAGTTTYADTNATGTGPLFYRVGVTAP